MREGEEVAAVFPAAGVDAECGGVRVRGECGTCGAFKSSSSKLGSKISYMS